MYVIREYLTDQIVAYASRKEDAIALISQTKPTEPRLILERI
jgi:hypothetical protein